MALDRQRCQIFVQPSFRKPFNAILTVAGFDERIYTEVPFRDSG